MSGSTSKKVAVYRFDRAHLLGYVNPQTWLQPGGIELLSPEGALSHVLYEEIKLVCFVRDWEGAAPSIEKRLFTSRPKTEGLWVRAQFRDNDFLEGILPNNLLENGPHGFLVVPPDPSANNQRIFLPKQALKEIRVLGVVGGTGKRRKAAPEGQIGLFDD